ncbi:MAG: hypothetical protein R6T98_08315 [Desulfatiglandales bacterium]
MNDQLVITLKQSVKLLTQLQTCVHDRVGWQEMLDTSHETIAIAGKSGEQKPIH